MGKLTDKCTEQFPLRLPSDLLSDVKRLAANDDRSPSDYIRRVLALHVYGHMQSVGDEGQDGNENRASHCNPQGCGR